MIIRWTHIPVSSKLEAVGALGYVKRCMYFGCNLTVFILTDYDTNKTVQCSSAFVYDKSRQRSLQHFIEFEDLTEMDKNVVLPSGK